MPDTLPPLPEGLTEVSPSDIPPLPAGFTEVKPQKFSPTSEQNFRRVSAAPATTFDSNFNTTLTPADEQQFKQWKQKYAPRDSGQDYDLRGAFKAGLKPDAKTGHWPDTFKKPNHPTFSDESQYARYGKPGHWEGERFTRVSAPAQNATPEVQKYIQDWFVNPEASGSMPANTLQSIIDKKIQGEDWRKLIPPNLSPVGKQAFEYIVPRLQRSNFVSMSAARAKEPSMAEKVLGVINTPFDALAQVPKDIEFAAMATPQERARVAEMSPSDRYAYFNSQKLGSVGRPERAKEMQAQYGNAPFIGKLLHQVGGTAVDIGTNPATYLAGGALTAAARSASPVVKIAGNVAGRGMAASMAAGGAQQAVQGVEQGDLAQILAGGAQTLLGGYGAVMPHGAPTADQITRKALRDAKKEAKATPLEQPQQVNASASAVVQPVMGNPITETATQSPQGLPARSAGSSKPGEPAAEVHSDASHLADLEQQARDRIAARKPKPAPDSAPVVREPVSGIEEMHPAEIGVKPGLQYKKMDITDTKAGVSNLLKGTDVFDTDQGGVLTVWRDENGKTWVVNGHHRLELAQRAGKFISLGPGGEPIAVAPKVRTRVLDAKDGWTLDDARRQGAIENIRDEKGTAVDALEALRGLGHSSEQLKQLGISLSGPVARNMSGLAKLDGMALGRIQNRDVSEHVGAGIGSVDGLSPEAQRGAMDDASRSKMSTYSEGQALGKEYLRDQQSGLLAQEASGGTIDMFGGEFGAVHSTRGVRVEIQTAVRKALQKTRSDLTKGIDVKLLEGEKINKEERAHLASQLGESHGALKDRLQLVFDRNEHVQAEIARLAGEVGNGRITVSQAAEQLAPTVTLEAGRSVRELVAGRTLEGDNQGRNESSVAPQETAIFQSVEDAARERINNRQRGLSSGVDPADIADITIIGAVKIARGVVDFAHWSAEMVREFGEAIKPHLAELYRSAKAYHDEKIDRQQGAAPKEKSNAVQVGRPTQEVPRVGEAGQDQAGSGARVRQGKQGQEVAAEGQAEAQGVEKTTGIAQRVQEKMAEEGRAKPYEPGKGIDIEDELAWAKKTRESGYDIPAHVERLEQSKAGATTRDMALMREEHRAFASETNKAEDKYGANSPEHKVAMDAEDAWYKRISKYRTESSNVFRVQQGEQGVDTGTFSGIRRAWEDVTDRPMTRREEEVAQNHVNRIKQLETDLSDLRSQIDAANQKRAGRTRNPQKLPTDPDLLREHFAKRRSGMQRTMTRQSGAINLTPGIEFTPDEVKAIWNTAKGYIDRGTEYKDVIKNVSSDLGLTFEEVNGVIAGNKSPVRSATMAYWKKLSDQRTAIQQAKAFIDNANTPGYQKVWKAVQEFPRALAVLGHGAVGMITHAGGNIARPSAWGPYWNNFGRQYRLSLSKGFHERAMYQMESHPDYALEKRAGLNIDPNTTYDDYQQYGKWLGEAGRMGNRGMDALKLFRHELFQKEWKATPKGLRTLDYAKELSEWVNHVSGSAEPGKIITAAKSVMFAPSLEQSRWSRTLGDPIKTAKTFVEWSTATDAQKAIAIHRVKRAGELAGVYVTMLAANAALQKANGQEDTVNFLDPTKSDWLRFKWNGRTLDPTGNMLAPLKFMAQIAKIAVGPQPKEYGNVGADISREQAAVNEAEFYARGKLAPQYSIAADIFKRADAMGRPLPYIGGKGTAGKPAYTPVEYLATKGPIPLSGAIKEFYESMREQGVDANIGKAILKGLEALPIEMTGARIGHTPKTGAPAGLKLNSTKELSRLGINTGDVKAALTIGRTKTPLSDDQRGQYRKAVTDRLNQIIDPVISNPNYKSLSDAQKKMLLERMIRKVRTTGAKSEKGALLAR